MNAQEILGLADTMTILNINTKEIQGFWGKIDILSMNAEDIKAFADTITILNINAKEIKGFKD